MKSPAPGISKCGLLTCVGALSRKPRFITLCTWLLTAPGLWAGFGAAADRIIPLPEIYLQPQDQTVPVGGSATFVVGAYSVQAYYWQFQDMAIPGANQATLTIVNADASKVGNYRVVVSNVTGAVYSDYAVLRLTTVQPAIYLQPQDQTMPVGGSATFVVGATSAQTCQWLFLDKAIPGANQTNLTIANAGASQAGNYRVVVSNVVGAVTSSYAALRLTTAVSMPNWDPIVIPDQGPAMPFGSSIVFSNLEGTIERLSVVLFGLTHSHPDDLDIGLLGPQGRFTYLMSDAGNGNEILSAFLEFRDQGATLLPDSEPITAGAYRPANYPPNDESPPPGSSNSLPAGLGGFTHLDPNGVWTLQVTDDSPENDGSLPSGWGLDLTLKLPEVNVFMVELRGANIRPPVATLARGFGLLQLTTNGWVHYDIAIDDLAGELVAAKIHGPGTNGSNAPKLFDLNYQRIDNNSGNLRGVVNGYLGSQLWHLRRGLHYIEVRTMAYTNGELGGQIVPLPLPTILESPTPQTVMVGNRVEFQVGATNPVALTYRWRLNRQPLSGATNATLVLTNVRAGQAGFYDVAVSNLAGVVTSAAAELRVEGQAGFEWIRVAPGTQDHRGWDTSGPIHQPRTIACGQIGASSRWMGFLPVGDGTLILETSGSSLPTVMAVYAGTNPAALQYLDCDASDSGAGFCWWETVPSATATNLVLEVDGLNGQQGRIAVNWRFGWAPQIGAATTNLTVVAGDPAVLAVQATGVPAPEYQWQFEGQDIPNATNAMHAIAAAGVTNAGEYRVVVSNFMGTESARTQLRVLTQPWLTKPYFDQGRLRFQVSCSRESTVVVEVSANLLQWRPVSTNDAPNGTVEFIDPETEQQPQRFYRARAF